MNEAFAAQVIANERAFDSDEFAKKYLAGLELLGIVPFDEKLLGTGKEDIIEDLEKTGAYKIILNLKNRILR